MKALFCTDGSDNSFFALDKACEFLKADTEIDSIYVIDWGFIPTYVTFPEEESEFPVQKEIAVSILNKTENIIKSKGLISGKKIYSVGNPVNVIIEAIEDNNYDLIILGSHGKKGIKKWLGSVSRKIVTKSTIPSFVGKIPVNKNIITLKPLKNILIATDGSSHSYNAIKTLINNFSLNNCCIIILTVRPGPESLPLEITMDNEWLENSLTKQKEIAEEILEETKNYLNKKNINLCKIESLEGDPAEVILKYTENNEIDLILMGSHGRKGLSEMLLGSTSKRVLDNSNISVLLVPLLAKKD